MERDFTGSISGFFHVLARGITRKLAKLILTLLTLPLLVVVWLLKWFVMSLYCCSAWIFYLLGRVLFATAVLSFLMKQSPVMEALQILKVNNKFYMVDMGIRNHILPRKRYDLGFTIGNIVYLELSRRGGKVNIGKYGSAEVDFVTQKEGVLTYYQVTADMTVEETFEREMRPLRSIQDNYEKIVLTLDRFSLGNYDGIKVVNVIDWLLG